MAKVLEIGSINSSFVSGFINRHSANRNKARRILDDEGVRVKELNRNNSVAEFRVQNESQWNKEYKVIVRNFDSADITVTCNCPYDMGDVCKHSVACLLFLKDELDNGISEAEIEFAAGDTNLSAANRRKAKLKNLDYYAVINIIQWDAYSTATQMCRNGQLTLEKQDNNKAYYNVQHKQKMFNVLLEYDSATEELIATCNCRGNGTKFCIHQSCAIVSMAATLGTGGLLYLKDWTAEKEKLLAEYGYSLSDNIEGKFEFKMNSNGVYLQVLDTTLHKLPGTGGFHNLIEKLTGKKAAEGENLPALNSNAQPQELIYVFASSEHADEFPDMSFSISVGKRKKNGEFYKNISPYFTYEDKEFLPLDENDLIITEAAASLDKRILLANSAYFNAHYSRATVPAKLYSSIQKETGEALEKVFIAGEGKTFYLGQLRWDKMEMNLNAPLSLSPQRLKLSFSVEETDEQIVLSPVFLLEGKPQKNGAFEKFSAWLQVKGNTIYKLNSTEDISGIEYFKDKKNIRFRTTDMQSVFSQVIKPLALKHPVTFKSRRQKVVEGITPAVNIYLKEHDSFLLFTPRFEYAHENLKEEALLNTQDDLYILEDNAILTIRRNLVVEKEYTEFFRSLHPDFTRNTNNDFYFLPFNKLMERGWFFEVFEKLKEKNVQVFGKNELTKIKYNTNRPKMQMRAGSGIDWFDMEIKVSFGDLEVSLAEIRKAIIAKQFYIPLSDGTIGVLPDEWIERYSSLFKIGKVNDNTIRVSKLHFTIIDALEKEIDNEKVLQELHEKKKKLLNFSHIEQTPLPKNVKATLRHYQKGGFHWLNFLHQFGWGGCLADDMGLGKTLQALTLLQHLKNKGELATSLVVVPTTLIFNWQAEVEKFCPGLSLHIHRGIERYDDSSEFPAYDIILTTYGTLRSDIEMFKKFAFDYIILDESQAVKNPAAQVSKAVRLLNAKHRLAMTGTPVENNTFDLYSQLEFLNPGFLGSQEFFREQFATSIDKYKDEKAAEQLRKLVAPFMLKRTKEKVAKDLPEKTETVLYCEMGKQQRKVYDTFQKKYKRDILEMIEKEGLNKSGFLILEGLLKLRQICDSPVIIGDAENNYGDESAKLEELVREISENASNHKILVFSQFLKMLDLIKQKLGEMNIPFTYLDGQTIDRKDKVDTFQQDDTIRVFLISLKAGGVGINLTEADYVYLVDPWWNPAVERQAIDRTHRIGQTKKVFAYKMICKNTVEEKILQLQEKKKFVANSLIDVDKNVMKKMTKEDIVELFS